MQNTNYPKRSSLVKRDGIGNFWVEGAELSALPPEIYMCICKLKDYEESGLSPSDVDALKQLYDDLVATSRKQKAQITEMKRKLLEVPVRPGDVIYDCAAFFYEDAKYPKIETINVRDVRISADVDTGEYVYTVREGHKKRCYRRDDFGRTVFLTYKRAEECARSQVEVIKNREPQHIEPMGKGGEG